VEAEDLGERERGCVSQLVEGAQVEAIVLLDLRDTLQQRHLDQRDILAPRRRDDRAAWRKQPVACFLDVVELRL
jgi:hypothetical protein